MFHNSLILHESFKELVDDAILKKTNVSNLGWRANDNEYRFNKKIINERIGNVQDRLSRKLTIERNSYFLKKIIELCDLNKIELVLLLPPYHPDFYKFTMNRYDKAIKEVLKQIDLKSALVIDSKYFKIEEDKYFENVDHLNDRGAIIFSKKIDSLLSFNEHD